MKKTIPRRLTRRRGEGIFIFFVFVHNFKTVFLFNMPAKNQSDIKEEYRSVLGSPR